ncbi:MAG TPA: hypothetical protein VJT73_14755, partial [Polyangiaceae bacterium]|nr:hypothetical protein [Polyangiaceae bacterium]
MLHAGIVALMIVRLPQARAASGEVRGDFWGGTTFEVPASLGEHGDGNESSEIINEIEVEGVESSGGTEASKQASQVAPTT